MVNPSDVITELLPALNSASTADLVFWSESELYQFGDEAVKRAAREAIIFPSVTMPAVLGGADGANLPSGASAVLWAAWNGISLREASVGELEALDDNWTSAIGIPTRWTLALGTGAIRLYPKPAQLGFLTLLTQDCPPTVALGSDPLPAIAPFAGFLLHSILGAARAKVSDAIMPEIAAHSVQRTGMYLDLFTRYWGSGS